MKEKIPSGKSFIHSGLIRPELANSVHMFSCENNGKAPVLGLMGGAKLPLPRNSWSPVTIKQQKVLRLQNEYKQ